MNKRTLTCLMVTIASFAMVCLFIFFLLRAIWSGNEATQKAVANLNEPISELKTSVQAGATATGERIANLATNVRDGNAEIVKAINKGLEELGKQIKDSCKPASPEQVTTTPPVNTTATPVSDDIPILIEQLTKEDGDIAKQAAKNLVAKQAVSDLMKVFLDGDSGLRERAKWCLVEIGEPALDELVNVGFASGKPEVRQAAISAVVKIGSVGQKTRNKVNEAASNSARPRVMDSALRAKEMLNGEAKDESCPTQKGKLAPRP